MKILSLPAALKNAVIAWIIALLSIASTSAVTVAWDPNPEPDIAGYRVYYGALYAPPQIVESSVPQATIDNLLVGAIYYFYVTAYNVAGLESEPSEELRYTVPVPPPAAPANLVASASTTSTGGPAVILSWTDSSSDEQGFRIYRSLNDIDYSELTELPAGATQWIDATVASGTTYHYAVRSFNAAGESVEAIASALPLLAAPAAPLRFIAKGHADRIALSWMAMNRATSYSVQRATSISGPYTSVYTGSANAFNDTSALPGVLYYYFVYASNEGGRSGNSPLISARTLSMVPNSPSRFAASLQSNGILLSWLTPLLTQSITVKRALAPEGPFQTIAAGVSGNSYLDVTAPTGVPLYYVVIAVNGLGESQPSSVIKIVR